LGYQPTNHGAATMKAQDRHSQLMTEVQAELAQLQATLANQPTAPNWCHVGDLAEVLSLLKQANGKES
jgi:hypothetical protein